MQNSILDAFYIMGEHTIHERSEFKKINDRWYYTTGVHTI